MAAGNWTFTNAARGLITDGTIATGDTFKMSLHTSASNLGASTTTFAGVDNEVSNGGYTAGGASITLQQSGTTTVTVTIQTAPVWTATGGDLTAYYACIYEVGGNVLCYALLDSSPADVTATTGNTLTVGSNGGTVYTLA